MTNNGRRWAAGIAVGLLALSLGAACSKKSEDATVVAGTSAAGKSTAAPSASPAAKSASPAAKGGDDAAEFAALFARYKDAQSRIDYEFTFAGAGAMSGTMSMRQGAGGRTRIDLATPQGTMMVITLPDKTYMCMVEEKMCLEGAGGPLGSNPVADTMKDFNTRGGSLPMKRIDNRRIAGIDGRCFEYTETSGKGVTCVGPEGQLLMWEMTTGGQTSKMTATKIEGRPAAADFEPPYPVMAMPAIPGGLGGFGVPPTPVR